LIIIAPMVVLQSVVEFHVHKAALPCTTRKQPRNVRECKAQALACVAAEVATTPRDLGRAQMPTDTTIFLGLAIMGLLATLVMMRMRP
jgi:ABC-type molybdate transport system permease subunit